LDGRFQFIQVVRQLGNFRGGDLLRLEQLFSLAGQFLDQRFLECLGQMRRQVGPGGRQCLLRAPFRLDRPLLPDVIGNRQFASGCGRPEITPSGQKILTPFPGVFDDIRAFLVVVPFAAG